MMGDIGNIFAKLSNDNANQTEEQNMNNIMGGLENYANMNR